MCNSMFHALAHTYVAGLYTYILCAIDPYVIAKDQPI